MARFKRLLRRALAPGWFLTLLLIPTSAALLLYTFTSEDRQHAPAAYAAYALSAYTLAVVCAGAPGLFQRLRAFARRNPYVLRYLSQRELRASLSLHLGAALNLLYAAFKLCSGVWFRSPWLGAVGAYYFLLCLIRLSLVRNVRVKHPDRVRQWRAYRRTGLLLFLLSGAISAMAVQMIRQNQGYSYPGLIIYASAAYTFYRLTIAIVNLVKYRAAVNPVLSAAKAIDLAVALMSIFALQTAMIAQFGGGERFRRIMNASTGGGVCLLVVCMAVCMILRSNQKLRQSH